MKIQYIEEIKKSIEEANLVVVGLGEEWNVSPDTQSSSIYQTVMSDLKAHPEYQWLLPYFYYKWTDDKLQQAYKNLFDLLKDKNYFVVATTTNRGFVPFVREDRFVMPCGTEEYMLNEELSKSMEYTRFVESLEAYKKGEISFEGIQFVKNEAGEVIPFNNIFAPGYKEEGYLPQWRNPTSKLLNSLGG